MASPSADESSFRHDDRDVPGVPDRLIHLPRRPLPALVAAYMAGIGLGIYFPVPFPVLVTLAIIGIGMAMLLSRLASSSWGIHFGIIMVGWASVALRFGSVTDQDLQRYLTRPEEHVEITAMVISHPQSMPPDARGRIGLLFDGRVESIRLRESFAPVSARIKVKLSAVSEVGPDIHYGDRLKLRGIMRLDERPKTKARGIVGYLSARHEQMEIIEPNAGNPFVAWCYSMRDSAQQRLSWGIDESSPSVALTRALLLGYRQDVPTRVYEAFARTGTLHILALSGMHVGILVLLLVVVLKSLGITRPYWIMIFLPILIAYTIGTGAASSMVRATIMSLVFFASFLLRRRSDTLTSLALAALLILIVDPLQLFDYGFILSFVAVGGIVLVYPALVACSRRLAVKDEWADPESSWLLATSSWRQRLEELFGISLAAWLVTLPLIATVFHLISPIALLVNIVLVPLSTVILLTSCLTIGVSFISFEITSILNHANNFFSDVLLYLVDRTSAIPGSHVYVSAWPLYLILAWYIFLLVWVVRSGKMRSLSAVGMIILIVFSLGQRSWSREVHAVVIPNGDACVLLMDGPGDHAMLVDSGSHYRQRELIEHLRSRGIGRLDRIVITRATSDAYSGLDGLLASMKVDEVLAPHVTTRQQSYQQNVAKWIEHAGPDKIRYWSSGQVLDGPNGLLTRLMFPPDDTQYENARNSSLILHISHGVKSILFMGTAGEKIERAAGQQLRDWNADVLVIGKCDDYDSLSVNWLKCVQPEWVLYSSRPFDRLPFGPFRMEERVTSMNGSEILDLSDGLVIEKAL